MPTRVAPDAASIMRLLAKLRRIPDEVRDFDVPPEEAWAEYRMPPERLREIVNAGLPVRGDGDAIRYDRSDLINVSLHLGIGPWAHALRTFLPRALNRAAQGQTSVLAVTMRAACPGPAHPGPCRYEVLTGDGPVRHASRPDVPLSTPVVRFRTRTGLPELPPAVAELAACVDGVDFVWLPESVREDLGFVREIGLGDCIAVSRLLVAEGRRRGLAVRPAYGLLTVVPQSIVHFWAELEVEGEWLPIDPVLIRALQGWGALDGDRWEAAPPLGAVACRLADDFVPLVTHAGVMMRYSLPTAAVESGRRNDG